MLSAKKAGRSKPLIIRDSSADTAGKRVVKPQRKTRRAKTAGLTGY
jgi:hypothetical protein